MPQESEIVDGVRQYTPSERLTEQVVRSFTYHPPRPDQVPRYGYLRDAAMELACMIGTLTPESREQSLALTKLEEAVMWANAAIARNEAEERREP